MWGVMRNLQILLEQSNLWKGELAESHFGKRAAGIFPRRVFRGRVFSLSGKQSDGLGKFYG
jgi:hypothetical protein